MSSPLHIEIHQNHESRISKSDIINMVIPFLEEKRLLVPGETIGQLYFYNYPELRDHIEGITVCEVNQIKKSVNMYTVEMLYHVYKLVKRAANFDNTLSGDYDQQPASKQWNLPAEDFHGLWENLFYDSNVKEDILNFAETALTFSERKVQSKIITWNKVILLYGPPGTGKTSLCKALAQKLSVRLYSRYTATLFIEINSHSLFSKWFSESAKLVIKLFSEIKNILESPDVLVCILIDEIETLTHARNMSLSGADPSDSVRVVNAILTQIDEIKEYANVLILTTSNVTQAIDVAFADRADIKQYVGPPSIKAIYKIYQTCIGDLVRAGVIDPPEAIDPFESLEALELQTSSRYSETSLTLYKLSEASSGLSGRSLRKIPFLAHALFIRSSPVSLLGFLEAMAAAVNKQLTDNEIFNSSYENKKQKTRL